MFLVTDLLGLSDSPQAAYEDQNAVLSRLICGNTVAWVESKIDDILNCFLFKENCVHFGMMIVCPFRHQGLDDSPLNFDLLGFRGNKVPPYFEDIPYLLHIAKCHNTRIFVPHVWLDAGVTFQHA